MDTSYEVRIYDAFYNLLLILYEWQSLEYGRVVNAIGALKLILDFSYFKILSGQKDAKIEVWRKPAGAQNYYLDGETHYLVHKIDLRQDASKQLTLTLYAFDTISILARRSVLFKAGTSQALKTAAIDDMSKTIVTENFIAPSDPLRAISNMTARANVTAAPSTTKGFSNRVVLDVLKDLADESYSKGTYLAFDLLWYPASASYVFQTFTGQRGVNRSATGPNANTGIVLDAEWDNLTEIVKSFDWTDEATYIQANGPGQDADRLAGNASDDTRLYGTPIGRIEKAIDARNASDQASTNSEANSALRDYRKRINYTARALDTDQIKFGRDYGFGDIVTAQIFGDAVEVRVDAYQIKVDPPGENVTVKLQATV
jgi:uncharacterized protein YfiM (DUF2279 family)